MIAPIASLVWWAGGLAALVLVVRSIVDVADHSRVAFDAAGYSRTAGLVVLGAGIALWPVASAGEPSPVNNVTGNYI